MLTLVTTAPQRTPQRTPQPERTRAMRTRLMQATIDCLIERGWAGTTTTLVSEVAGVSRGAQLHHFHTKHELVVASLEHLSEQMTAELQRRHDQATRGKQRSTRSVLTMLADYYTSDLFVASLELWVAARTDEPLREIVRPMERRWGREEHELAVAMLAADDSDRPTRALVQATLDMLRGFGLANTLSDDTRRRNAILAEWSTIFDATARRTTTIGRSR
ncbi:TetR family transcriptional regulator [Flexivirga endophytica]|uniref:TetR family transcriptional regulator n=1 Tax=Flexivirga endophytica TaxID=1849103 RepID=A0A916WS03_9MICO|nr:TetR family transcriptional regulator [Flexivirga endophytica]GHB55695.1 TetR family transcriptional regulator [Flexivirga endophytica]